MESEFARQYYESARSDHWWFQGRAELVGALLARGTAVSGLALDLGAGTESLFPATFDVIKLDLVRPAGDLKSFVQASALELPFPDGKFDAVGAFDLIEHIEDAVSLMSEIARVVLPGGIVLATVPAHQWLWSPHDERVGHVRRYERGEIAALFEAAELRIVWCSSFYGFLVLPAIVRKVLRLSTTMGNPGSGANRALTIVSRASARRALRGRTWGLSIGVMAFAD